MSRRESWNRILFLPALLLVLAGCEEPDAARPRLGQGGAAGMTGEAARVDADAMRAPAFGRADAPPRAMAPEAASPQPKGPLEDDAVRTVARRVFMDRMAQLTLSRKAEVNTPVQDTAIRLIAKAESLYAERSEGFEWEIVVFDRPATAYAWCLPGGKIGVDTGLLPLCENEAGLAYVLAHEIAHALLRHDNARLAARLGAVGGPSAIEPIVKENAPFEGPVRRAIFTAFAVDVGGGGVLPYGQEEEMAADRVALELMASAGYDPKAAPAVWQRMGRSGGAEYLSVHPAYGRRLRQIRALQEQAAAVYRQADPQYGMGEKLVLP